MEVAEPGLDEARLRELIRVDLVSTSCKKGYPSAVGPGPWVLVGEYATMEVRPSVEVVGSGTSTNYPAPYAVNAYSRQVPSIIRDGGEPVIGVMEFLNTFLLPANPETYGVAVRCCDGTDHFVADVEVFPAQEWSGELSVKFSPDKVTYEAQPFRNQGRRNRGYLKEIRTRNFEASCSISAKYLNETIAVEFPAEFDFLKKVTTVLSKVRDVEELAGKANKLTGVKGTLSINYPVVKLSGALKRREEKGTWSVGYGGEVGLKFSPLIGLKAEVDILDALIAAASSAAGTPWLGKVILEAKTAAAEGRLCEISLKLTGNADILGGLKWEGSESLLPTGGELGGAIGLKIEGVVASANSYFNVAAGANLGGESKFSALVKYVQGKPLSLKPNFEWTGITVYYGVFVQRTKGTEFGQVPTLKDQLKGSDGKMNRKRQIQLVEAWADPPKPAFGHPAPDSQTDLAGFMR
jgi:hypothetical protein